MGKFMELVGVEADQWRTVGTRHGNQYKCGRPVVYIPDRAGFIMHGNAGMV